MSGCRAREHDDRHRGRGPLLQGLLMFIKNCCSNKKTPLLATRNGVSYQIRGALKTPAHDY